jgi:hypothetical protein
VLTETYLAIATAGATIIAWIIYYNTRKSVIQDNLSHEYPAKTKASTIRWIVNSLIQTIGMTILVFLPYSFIVGRPQTESIVPTDILTFSMILLLVISAFAIGAHTLSVYLFEFIDKEESRLHAANELFHGPISHIPPYLAIIMFTWIFAILEKQHPNLMDFTLMQKGIVIFSGLIAGMGISAGSMISDVSSAIFKGAFINTLLWFLLITGRFQDTGGPITTFAVAVNITVIGCNGVFRTHFKRYVYSIYKGPKL